MEFKKKYPCTQCIFLTTKESTLAKHMKRHQNIGEQVSNSFYPSSSDMSPVLSSSPLPQAFESSKYEETNLSSSSMIADKVKTSKRIKGVIDDRKQILSSNEKETQFKCQFCPLEFNCLDLLEKHDCDANVGTNNGDKEIVEANKENE